MLLFTYAWKCLVRIYFSVVYESIRLTTKIDEKKVLFISDVRERLEGNLKCVWEQLGDCPYTKRTYLKGDRRDRIRLKKFNQMIYDFATSKYILLEDYFRYTSYVRPKKGQQICQLWHACGAYKKFGYSRAAGGEHIKIHKGYKKYAKAITSSESVRKDYAEAFGISKEKVKATGIPRTDMFFDEKLKESKKQALYKKYPVLREKRVILFAPTYRGLRAEDAKYDFEKIDYEKLYEEFGKDYVFAVKWHPALYNNLKRNDVFSSYIKDHPEFYIDVSGEREINDLLLAADLLITDYSSVIFEFALLDKPIIYFAYDLEKYENSRGLYYQFNDYVYGAVTRNFTELSEAIKKCDLMWEDRKKFIDRFMGACDGQSTSKVCDWIFSTEA